MATEQMFTSLPTVATAQMSDIICAVQGFTASPLNLGLSVQETLQQVYNLFQSNIILFNDGNPNGVVAGTTYQFCWDTLEGTLWICTTSGSAATAVWTPINNQNWTAVTTAAKTCAINGKYITSYSAGIITYTLPTNPAQGTTLRIAGLSSGGWTIVYGTGQSIIVGDLSTTVTTGSLTSTNQNDSVELLCTTANTTYTLISGVGNFTIM